MWQKLLSHVCHEAHQNKLDVLLGLAQLYASCLNLQLIPDEIPSLCDQKKKITNGLVDSRKKHLNKTVTGSY